MPERAVPAPWSHRPAVDSPWRGADRRASRGRAGQNVGMDNPILGWIPLVVFLLLAVAGTIAGILQSQT